MYVGVILKFILVFTTFISVPHVCGGDPNIKAIIAGTMKCSPCMWG